MKYSLVISLLIMLMSGCKSKEMLTTVNQLDLNRYQGTWYEIARLPNSFEKNLSSVTATYTIKANGKIEVINRGYKNGDKLKSIKGTAWVPNAAYPGRLKVRFFWPFAGDYYVIFIDENYQVALVGSPSRNFLWILARQPEIDEATYKNYLQIASAHNFNITELIRVDQSLHSTDK